jgi:hypothetical protein
MWHGHLARAIFKHGLEARATMGAEIRSTYYFAATKPETDPVKNIDRAGLRVE